MVLLLEWFSVFVTIIGSVLTILKIDPINIYLMNFGSFLWIIWGIVVRRFSIVIVNLVMLIIYMLGILERMNIINFVETI